MRHFLFLSGLLLTCCLEINDPNDLFNFDPGTEVRKVSSLETKIASDIWSEAHPDLVVTNCKQMWVAVVTTQFFELSSGVPSCYVPGFNGSTCAYAYLAYYTEVPTMLWVSAPIDASIQLQDGINHELFHNWEFCTGMGVDFHHTRPHWALLKKAD